MEDRDDCVPQDQQAIRDRIDDEIVNHELMERAPEQRDDRTDRNNKARLSTPVAARQRGQTL
jgi:hypothetical protein